MCGLFVLINSQGEIFLHSTPNSLYHFPGVHRRTLQVYLINSCESFGVAAIDSIRILDMLWSFAVLWPQETTGPNGSRRY